MAGDTVVLGRCDYADPAVIPSREEVASQMYLRAVVGARVVSTALEKQPRAIREAWMRAADVAISLASIVKQDAIREARNSRKGPLP